MRFSTPRLWLACVALAAAPALAQHEGFGGAPADDDDTLGAAPFESAPAEGAGDDSACLLPDESGAWRPCDEVLGTVSRPSTRESASADEGPPLTLPPSPDDEKPKIREISTKSAPKGAYGRLVSGVGESVKEEFPLLVLRERVQALADEAKALADDPVRYRDAPKKREEHEAERVVLERVEKVAFHLMRSCIATEMPEWSESYTPPSLYRMTPGGPVPASPEERRKLPAFDPPGCERIRLVDDATIAKVRRLVEIEHTLRNGGLGYFERDQRKSLEAEKARLQQDLGEGGPAPLPKLFGRERSR